MRTLSTRIIFTLIFILGLVIPFTDAVVIAVCPAYDPSCDEEHPIDITSPDCYKDPECRMKMDNEDRQARIDTYVEATKGQVDLKTLDANNFTQGIVLCGRDTASSTGKTAVEAAKKAAQSCDFQAFIVMLQRLVNYAIILGTLFMVAMIAYTGWEYLNAGGEPGKLSDLKERLTNIVIGMVIILGSWLVVRTFSDYVLTSDSVYKTYIYLTK